MLWRMTNTREELLKAWLEAEVAYREASAPYFAVGFLQSGVEIADPEKNLDRGAVEVLTALHKAIDDARVAYENAH